MPWLYEIGRGIYSSDSLKRFFATDTVFRAISMYMGEMELSQEECIEDMFKTRTLRHGLKTFLSLRITLGSRKCIFPDPHLEILI